jgi:hypothetical protein
MWLITRRSWVQIPPRHHRSAKAQIRDLGLRRCVPFRHVTGPNTRIERARGVEQLRAPDLRSRRTRQFQGLRGQRAWSV